MEYGAIDLHKKESQIRIVTEGGEIIDRRIATTRERLTAVFWGRPRMRILLEAATESEWVAQHLETLGHEVVVADPNFTAMYGHRSRRIKTDRRDVAALADVCPRGIYRAAHRRSAAQRTVQCPAEHSSGTDGQSDTSHFIGPRDHSRRRISPAERRYTQLPPPSQRTRPAGVHASARSRRSAVVIEVLDEELTRADETFEQLVADDPVVSRLTTLPGIGPITASAYVAALDDVTRFGGAAQVASYLGLVPREYSSGEQQRRGRIMRSAHPYVQALLVQAAWRISRSKDARTATLRTWAEGIARRRGKKIAMVALARRLARLLFAMWRDEVAYDPAGFGRRGGRWSQRVMAA